MRRLSAAGAAALVLTAALGLAGCSSTKTPPQPSASELERQSRIISSGADQCLDDEHQKKLVAYGSDGLGYLTGSGDTGVVLMHQVDSGLCQWVPNADLLGVQGLRGFAIDVNGGSIDNAVGAVAYLRSQGVKKVYLVGASMGGTIALAAAAKTPVDAVLSLSGPANFGGVDAETAVKSLTIPVLFAAGEYDQPFADSARLLYSECPSKQKRLLILPTGQHGVSLLASGMKDTFDAFLADPVATVAAKD
jgi:pimeloyl-ACP methyl ester carboxylesterase